MQLAVRTNTRPVRRFALVMVWTSFYEQLSWTPLLVVLAAAAGSPEALAFAASAYSTANLAGNAFFGYLSDRMNRTRVASWAFLALAGSTLLHLKAETPGLLIGIRFIHGLAAAAIAPAVFASLADGAPRDRRGEVMARAGLVIALASMMAPALNGILKDALSLEATLGILAGTLTLVGLTGIFVYPEPNAAAKASTRATPRDRNASAARAIDGRLLGLSCAIGFAVMFCQNTLFYAFPLKTEALGMKASVMGPLLSSFALGAVFAFLPPLSRLSDRIGRRVPVALGLSVGAVGLLALTPTESVGGMALALFLYGLGFGLIFPSVSALNADAVGAQRRGLGFGLLTAAFSAGAIAGPLITHALRFTLAPFTVGGLVLLVSLVGTVALLWRRT